MGNYQYITRENNQCVAILSPCEETDISAFLVNLINAVGHSRETALVVDCEGGRHLANLGLICDTSLTDAVSGEADIGDVLYICPEFGITGLVVHADDLDLCLGSIAALSLNYDRVFVIAPNGCTRAHVRLCGLCDHTIMTFELADDRFMRTYWNLDAVRRRFPRFSPVMVASGQSSSQKDFQEVADLLTQTIQEFLGAPPPILGHLDSENCVARVLASISFSNAMSDVA